MHQCPKCGFSGSPADGEADVEALLGGGEGEGQESDLSDEGAANSVLKELLAILGKKSADGLRAKPAAVSLEIDATKPKEDDEQFG